MTDPRFQVLDATAAHTAAPAIAFGIGVTETSGAPIHTIVLHVQAQIEPRTRRYSPAEQERVYALFGAPVQWDRSLRPIPWTQTTIVVPAFTGRTEVVLPVPVTYDLEAGASRYLHAIREGEITVRFLFSGTIFVAAGRGFSVEQVPWDREALYSLPAGLWTRVMDAYFPGCGWVRLRRETIDALLAFRDREALVTWDDTMTRLLPDARAQEPS